MMRKLGVEEWIINIFKAMYTNANSKVRVNGSYSAPFEVKVGTLYGPHNVGKISIVNDFQKNEILTKTFLFIKILVSSEGFLIKKI